MGKDGRRRSISIVFAVLTLVAVVVVYGLTYSPRPIAVYVTPTPAEADQDISATLEAAHVWYANAPVVYALDRITDSTRGVVAIYNYGEKLPVVSYTGTIWLHVMLPDGRIGYVSFTEASRTAPFSQEAVTATATRIPQATRLPTFTPVLFATVPLHQTSTPTNTLAPDATTTPFPTPYYVSIRYREVSVRSCASLSCRQIGVVNTGDELLAMGDEGDFWLVEVPRRTGTVLGYVLKSSTRQESSPTPTRSPSQTPSPTSVGIWYVDSTFRVKIRSCGSISCEAIAGANHGETIRVIRTIDNWHEIQLPGGRTGWISAWLTSRNNPVVMPTVQLTTQPRPTQRPTSTPRPTRTPRPSSPTPTTTTWYVIATNGVNIRSCSSTSCQVVRTADPGDPVRVIRTVDDWHEIRLPDGSTGYIAAWLTSRSRPVVQPTQRPVQVQPTSPPQQQPPPQVQPTQPPAPSYTCDCSKACSQMTSCNEAYYQLNTCGCNRRDSDNDGVPCESICPGG